MHILVNMIPCLPFKPINFFRVNFDHFYISTFYISRPQSLAHWVVNGASKSGVANLFVIRPVLIIFGPCGP